jgi:hypothetical protein
MKAHVTLRGVLLLCGGELSAFCPRPNQYYPCYAFRHCLLNIVATILWLWQPYLQYATWGHALPGWHGTSLKKAAKSNTCTLTPTSPLFQSYLWRMHNLRLITPLALEVSDSLQSNPINSPFITDLPKIHFRIPSLLHFGQQTNIRKGFST